jgi:hypothetical protein
MHRQSKNPKPKTQNRKIPESLNNKEIRKSLSSSTLGSAAREPTSKNKQKRKKENPSHTITDKPP